MKSPVRCALDFPSVPTYQVIEFLPIISALAKGRAIKGDPPNIRIHTFESVGEAEAFYEEHTSAKAFNPVIMQYARPFDAGDPPFDDPGDDEDAVRATTALDR